MKEAKSKTKAAEVIKTFKPNVKQPTGIFYVRIKESNKAYLTNIADSEGISLSQYTDQLVDELRDRRII